MGRPVSKRFFGTGAGNQIRVRAKIGANAEGDGYIIRQRTSNKYQVKVGANTGVCQLVDKANGALAANEMTITVLNDASASHRVKKLFNRVAKLFNNTIQPWTFTTSGVDAKVDVPEATDLAITAQPVNRTGIGAGATTFAVTATATPAETITYQWQISTDSGATWSNLANGGVYTTATTATLNISSGTGLAGRQYRCVVSSATAASVTSAAATLIS